MTDAFQNNQFPGGGPAFSPLDQVARFFRQFGGGPAPAPPPNLEQQNDGGQPNAPTQRGQVFNWANNVLPPGSRTPPPARIQPFMRASLDRPPEQWGQEERFPNLPHSFEAPQLAQGLSQWFGQNGSVPIQQLAMSMGPHAAEFLAGVQKGQQERMVMAREQLAMHITEMNERQTEEMTRYAEVMSAHGALNETQDPAKMVKPVGGKSLMEDLYDTAREIGDIGRPGTLGDLIASGAKPSEVEGFLQARDKRLRDLQKLKGTVDQDTADEAKWGLAPKQTPAATQGDIGPYSGYQAPGAAAEPTATAAVDPATGAPAPSPVPAPKDKVAGPGAPSDTTGDVPPPETPVDAIATDVVRGVEPDATFAKNFPKPYHEAVLRGAQQKAELGNIVRNPPQNRDQILPMIRRINPQVANDVAQVLDYRVPASGGTSGTGASLGSKASQYGDTVRNLVTLINPNFNQGFYQDQQRFRNDVQTRTVLLRTKDLAPMAERLNDDLRIIQDDLRKRGLSPNDVNLNGLMRMFANDPKYLGLNKDFVAYNDAYNTIVSGGRHTIGGTHLQMEGISPYAPLATYRNVIKGHMYGVNGMIEGEMDHWVSIGGKETNMPDFDTPRSQAVWKSLRDFRDMDYVSGARPYDPANPDNDIVVKKAGPWGPAGRYYWVGGYLSHRDDPKSWQAVK